MFANASASAKRFFSGLSTRKTEQTSVQEYKQKRLVGYSRKQMHSIVSDVDSYSQFVPWCVDSIILARDDPSSDDDDVVVMTAELAAGFYGLNERYCSTVRLYNDEYRITASASNTRVFKTLVNEWHFVLPDSLECPSESTDTLVVEEPAKKDEESTGAEIESTKGDEDEFDCCIINFHVAFDFHSVLFSQVSRMFLDEVGKMMIKAFEKRAFDLYGPPSCESKPII